jgi:hypothetical protein
MFFTKSSIDQILGIDSCVVSIFNDIIERVSDDERLTKKLWEEYFYDVIELIDYTPDTRYVHQYEEFEDYLMGLIVDTPELEYPLGHPLDLDEMSDVLSIIGSVSNVCSLIEDYQSMTLCPQHSQQQLLDIVDRYKQEIDSHEFTDEEQISLWELLETKERTDDFLFDSLCIQDRIVNDEYAIRNYVNEKLGEKMTIDEMRDIVQLCFDFIDNDVDEDEDSYEYEDIYECEEDEL